MSYEIIIDDDNLSGFFGNWFDGLDNKQIAMEVFKIYANEAKRYNQNITADQIFSYYRSKSFQLSEGIKTVEASFSDIRKAMENLAQKTGGGLPRNINSFVMALSGQLTSVPVVDATVKVMETVNKITSQAGRGVDAGLTSWEKTNKIFNYAALIVGLGVLGFVWSQFNTTLSVGKKVIGK